VNDLLGTRRQASNRTGSKCGWSAPAPVPVHADRIKWQAVATAIPSFGSPLTVSERVRLRPLFASFARRRLRV